MASETTDVDLTGRKIREYELLRRIGVGGMGVVYEGRHPVIGKRVAVKFLLSALSADKDLVERFKVEARSVNEIGHRGIVDIFDFGALEDGTQYFVMELLEGRGFDQVIRAEAPLHPAIAVRYLEEIVDALAAAHSAGVIHRDIKPSNVFLVESARSRPYIKLLDFGIAKVNATKTGSTPQTRQSVVIGTPEYIAPEQAQGKAIGAATDLYAVGCMAYEMLTGKLPFRGENPLDTMFKHVTEPTPRVSAIVPGTPQSLDDLVFALMQKRVEDRPKSAEEVLKRLEETRGGVTADLGAPRPSGPRPSVALAVAPAPLATPTPAVDPADSAALANTYQSLSSVKVPLATDAAVSPPQRRTGVALALGAVGVVVVGAVAWTMSRPPPEPILVEPPPLRVAEARPLADAGAAEAAPAVVAPVVVAPVVVAPVVVAPAPVAVPDAGAAPVAPKKALLTHAQLLARIATLERRLEAREAVRGEVNKVFRSFMKQARDDTEKAKTEADRRQVWAFLDEVARQLDR